MKLIFSLSISTIFLISCGESGTSIITGNPMLPENPKKIEILWNSGGGMINEGEAIFISEDSCYYDKWQDQADIHLLFKMSKDEIRALYQGFIDHDFNDIDVLEEQEVYDRGGTSIDVNCDNVYFRKSNSGMSFVMENDWDDYAAIEDAIYAAAIQRVEHYKMNSIVKISDNLVKSNLAIALTVNNDKIYDNTTDTTGDAIKTEFNKIVYQGENQFIMSLYDRDSINGYGGIACLTTVWFTKYISDTSNTVVFDYEDGTLFGK